MFGIVVSTSDYHPRGPGFKSRLCPRNFSGSVGSGTWSTQPCEANWVSTVFDMRSSGIRLRKLKLRLWDSALLTTRSPVLRSGSNPFSRPCPFGAVSTQIIFYILTGLVVLNDINIENFVYR